MPSLSDSGCDLDKRSSSLGLYLFIFTLSGSDFGFFIHAKHGTSAKPTYKRMYPVSPTYPSLLSFFLSVDHPAKSLLNMRAESHGLTGNNE